MPASATRATRIACALQPRATASGQVLPRHRRTARPACQHREPEMIGQFAPPPAPGERHDTIAARLRAPRAAAIAGIVFSVLLISSLVLLRLSVPADPLEAGAWLQHRAGRVALALNLVPFAGIAFLWFIGVLRDRLGEREDRFFATVFLGSGLLFLALLFVAAAMVGAIIIVFLAAPDRLLGTASFTLARAIAYEIMNIYAIRMAAVFMIATSTLALRTGFIARWIAFLGYALALLLLFSSRYVEGILVVFPLWVLLVSVQILASNLRGPPQASGHAAER